MAHDQVAAAAGQPRALDFLGAEPAGEALVEPLHGREPVEHLLVARGVGVSPGHGVAPVLAVFARRVEELAALGQRLVQSVAEPPRVGAVQPVGVAVVGLQKQCVRVGRVSSNREFLDQPGRPDFEYPRMDVSSRTTVPADRT
ncbi:hypothetical protein GCM10027435_29470 [Haloparvum alkalitolerans]